MLHLLKYFRLNLICYKNKYLLCSLITPPEFLKTFKNADIKHLRATDSTTSLAVARIADCTSYQ